MQPAPAPEDDRAAVAEAEAPESPQRTRFEPRRRIARPRTADRWSAFG